MRGAGLFVISSFALAAIACSAPPPPSVKAPETPAAVVDPEPVQESTAPAAAPQPPSAGAGVVRTSVEVPPRNEPTADDVLKLQKELAARHASSDEEKLKLALLHAAAGNLEEAERVMSTVKNRTNRMLPYMELYLRRELGDHPGAGKLLARLEEEDRASTGFAIARAELVTRVRRFRDYAPAESDRVAPGGEIHLYVEPTNFAAQKAGDKRTIHLRYEWALLDDHSTVRPVPAWDEAPAEAREDRVTSNGPIAEFYQSFRLPLPVNLAAGKYRVRVTVTDVIAGKSDRHDVPIEVMPVERTR
ncbi:MAG TPA: hypothetical protein VE981_23750 [Planctomycetota bacterium]|nr:hypothetical protein [Planctomycetota bacterium]